MLTPIHHAFAPHVDRAYLLRSLRLLLQPARYRRGSRVAALEQEVSKRISGETITFGSGRQALLALLRTIAGPGNEVIVQGYTCVVVSNAIHAAGAAPIYADIEPETLNIDPLAAEKLITSRTKAIICQHTFGIPSNTPALRALCDKHGILLIEDCAHIFPDARGPAAIGRFGDAVLFSFGRDKALSGVAGGAIVVRRPELAQAVRKLQEQAVEVPWTIAAAYLLYPLIYATGRPLIAVGIGRYFLWFVRQVGLLVPIVLQEEKEGRQPLVLERMPNGCAELALSELSEAQRVNDHRRMLTKFYLDTGKRLSWRMLSGVKADLPLQKFPIFTKNAEKIRRALRSARIHLEDGWQQCVICPPGSDSIAAGYLAGSDPQAEAASEQILSLPTHPTMTMAQAAFLVEKLSPLLHTHR